MWFKDREHEAAFEALREEAGASDDREALAALYVLAALKKDVRQYAGRGSIKFGPLLDQAGEWSSGEKALARLAAGLFNEGTWPVLLGDVFCSLDQANARVAMEALRLRYSLESVV